MSHCTTQNEYHAVCMCQIQPTKFSTQCWKTGGAQMASENTPHTIPCSSKDMHLCCWKTDPWYITSINRELFFGYSEKQRGLLANKGPLTRAVLRPTLLAAKQSWMFSPMGLMHMRNTWLTRNGSVLKYLTELGLQGSWWGYWTFTRPCLSHPEALQTPF